MVQTKENYREFEMERFVYHEPAESSAGPTTAPAVEPKADKKVDAKQAEAKKQPDYVQTLVQRHKDSIGKDLRKIETNYLPSKSDSNPQKYKAAVKFINKMQAHSDATFKKITDEHAIENMDVGKARKRATEAVNKINELIAGHKEHIEHIERVDTAESHEKAGEDVEKTEEKITKEKINALSQIVQNKYKNVDSAIVKKISTYIVENNPNLVELDLDVDDYENMQTYLEAVAESNKALGESIDAEFLTAYTKILEITPYLVPTEADIEIVGQELDSNADLKEISKEQKGAIVKALATRFNIQMENGEIKYVIDHKDNTILDREAFVTEINNEASRVIGGRVLRKTRIRKLVGSVEDISETKQKARETALGINSIKDFADNKDVQELIADNKKIQSGLDEMEEIETKEQNVKEETLAKKEAEDQAKQKVEEARVAKENAEKNTKANKPKVDVLNSHIASLNELEEVTISTPKDIELSQDELTLAPYKLLVDGKDFGSIAIDNPSAIEAKDDSVANKADINVTISIDNGNETSTTLLSLETELKGEKLTKLKENHEKAQKNKGEILGVLGEFKAEGIEIKKPDLKDVNLTEDKVDGIKGNITTADNNVIGTLILDVSYDSKGEPTYKYKVADAKEKEASLASIAEVNTHLTTNQKQLVATAKEAAEEKESKEESEVIDSIEKPKNAKSLKALIETLKLTEFINNESEIISNFDSSTITDSNFEKIWENNKKELAKVSGDAYLLEASIKFFNYLKEDRIDEILSGNGKLSPKEMKEFKSLIGEGLKNSFTNLEEVDKGEVNLLKAMKVNIKDKETTLGAELGDKFMENLSRIYTIKSGENGKIKILANGSKEKPKEVDAKELGEMFNGDLKVNYLKIINDEGTPKEIREAKEGLQKDAETMARLMDASVNGDFDAMVDAISGGNPESLKGFGLMDLIALFQMLSNADPDDVLSILGDIAMDISHNRSPLKTIKEAKNKYDEKVKDMTNVSELLEYINNPGGEKANIEFGPKLRYRTTLRKLAQDKLAKDLGIPISKFEQSGGVTKLTTNIKGKAEIIEITQELSGLSVLRYQPGIKPEDPIIYPAGFENGKPQALAGTVSITALYNSLGIGTARPEVTTQEADTKLAESTPETESKKHEGVDVKYVENNGVLKDVASVSINDVLNSQEIDSATIEIKEGIRGKQILPTGAKTITVTKNTNNKFVISKIEDVSGNLIKPNTLTNQKLSIFDGDKITNTEKIKTETA